jgi:hypothetical protein
MSKKCLKCEYVRQPTDTAPDYECPNCGVVYAKFEAAMNQNAAPQPNHSEVLRSDKDSSSDVSFEFITPRAWHVTIHKDGKAEGANIRQQFTTHGPYVLNNYRIDKLERVEVFRDASTVTSHGTTKGTTTTSTMGQIGRGIVGGVIAGPVGAIIGGGGASQKTESATVTHQKQNLDMYLMLTFRGGESLLVEVKNEGAFQFLVSSAGQEEWPQQQIESAEREAQAYAEWLAKDNERKRQAASLRDEQYKGYDRRFISAVGAIVLIVIMLNVFQNMSERSERRAVDQLISEGRYDEALGKIGTDDYDRRNYIVELKRKSESKMCNEKSLADFRKWASESSESKTQFLLKCDQVIRRTDAYFDTRKEFLTEAIGRGVLKTEAEIVSFLESNYPGSKFSAASAFGSVSIGRERYELRFQETEGSDGFRYTLSGLEIELRHKASDKNSYVTEGASSGNSSVVECGTVAAVANANRSQMPPGTTVSDIVEMARSQGKCK